MHMIWLYDDCNHFYLKFAYFPAHFNNSTNENRLFDSIYLKNMEVSYSLNKLYLSLYLSWQVLDLSKVKHFILDECDRLLAELDMRKDVQQIFMLTPHEKQVIDDVLTA